MSTRTDRIEARLAPETAERIKQAAALRGVSASAFLVEAAADKADQILSSWHETVVPSEFFDDLLRSLDESAEPVPALQKAFARLRELTREDPLAREAAK